MGSNTSVTGGYINLLKRLTMRHNVSETATLNSDKNVLTGRYDTREVPAKAGFPLRSIQH